MKDLFDVKGKVVIVTGGSRGIGAMIARGFVENGARTYITSRTAEQCKATAEELSQYGECTAIPGDLSTMEGIKKFASEFSAKESKLDVLINNAGVSTEGGSVAEFPESNWDFVMDVNLKSPFFVIQTLLPQLKASAEENAPARIINIASNAGITPPHRHPDFAYTTSKAGVIMLSKHLAMVLCRDKINVNTISPGLFPSEMTKSVVENFGEKFAKIIPCGRIGEAEDAAGAAIFLASKASAWLTGVNIPVDGGNIVKR